ncbi:MAG: nucleotidyltransferase domain-containing protein [Mangrovibacterium sp.]
MFGLLQEQILSIKGVFANHPRIQRAIVYGSRAKGNYRQGSDLDVCLMGKDLLFDELLRIETELDDLLLPIRIDVSLFDQIDNPDLIAHIERVGITV